MATLRRGRRKMDGARARRAVLPRTFQVSADVGSSLYGLIPAAGSGERFGAGMGISKQYLPLISPVGALPAAGPLSMLYHSIAALMAVPEIELVFVVLAPNDVRFRRLALGPWEKRVAPLYCGGASRRDSVLNGLVAASSAVETDDWVLVHDAARPCLGEPDLRRLIDTVCNDPEERGGILALPVSDTLKRAAAGPDPGGEEPALIEATLPRDGLWQAQTPQMFRHGVLLDALRGDAAATDEASAVEKLGHAPRLVEGSSRNIKVTYAPDLELAAMILQSEGRL
jgi:2-C-methyl-D-erythritol 4-phosphate cytidylyltransferase